MNAAETPKDISQKGPRELAILWQDGHESVYPVRFLRQSCACAGCVDEWSGALRYSKEDIDPDVHPTAVKGVGHYAIHISWSDGHDSGIYTFERLRKLCPCRQCQPAGAAS